MENRSIELKTLAGFTAAAIVLVLVIIGVTATIQSFIASSRDAWLSMEMSSSRERIYAALADGISNHHAHVVTGEEKYVRASAAAMLRLRLQLETLRRQASGASTQMRRLEELEQPIEQLAGILDETQQGDASALRTRTLGQSAARIQDQLASINALLTQLGRHQAQQLAQRLDDDDRAANLLYFWLPLAAVVLFMTLTWLSRRITADLHRRRDVEARLQEANGFLESLLDNIPAMIFAKDAEQLRFVLFNRAGENLLGYPRDALLGKSDLELFPGEQAKFFIDKDREVLALGDIVDIPEEEIDTQAMGRRVLHTRKVPIRDASGRPRFLLGISMDITEQKATQQRMLALNEELRHHAALVEASNRELESFCYSISHDLRAPLRAINGFARLLEQDFASRLDGEAPRYLRTICGASERMGQLIDDLLEFSRIGRQVLECQMTDMRAMVNDIVNDVVTPRDRPAPRVEIGDLPAIRCDRRLLHLVWLNLLDNAVKYSAAAPQPTIRIHADVRDHEVIYCIRDNGVGFDMRYYGKLFGVFQRLHADAAYPGTGVGLAISQRVIARHGGRIWAESAPGNGALFCFSLPTAA